MRHARATSDLRAVKYSRLHPSDEHIGGDLIDAASHNLQQHRRPRNAPAVGDLEREGLHEQELDLLLGQRAEAADLLEGEAAVGGRSLEDLSTPLKVDQPLLN